jgi:hypothetical protein
MDLVDNIVLVVRSTEYGTVQSSLVDDGQWV